MLDGDAKRRGAARGNFGGWQIGRCNEQIQFQARSFTTNDFNEEVEGWASVGSLYFAEVRQFSAKEKSEAGFEYNRVAFKVKAIIDPTEIPTLQTEKYRVIIGAYIWYRISSVVQSYDKSVVYFDAYQDLKDV